MTLIIAHVVEGPFSDVSNCIVAQALRDILSTPEECRDALRVTLHLVEKSLQRITRNYKNAMYTSQKSIENKVGAGGRVSGWKDLLISVGFRFEPAANGIPASVFFPQVTTFLQIQNVEGFTMTHSAFHPPKHY